jgi:hypothetical protein
VIVISDAGSGVQQMSSNERRFRTCIYFGMYRPARRRNQTGVRSNGILRHARTKRPIESQILELFFLCVISSQPLSERGFLGLLSSSCVLQQPCMILQDRESEGWLYKVETGPAPERASRSGRSCEKVADSGNCSAPPTWGKAP